MSSPASSTRAWLRRSPKRWRAGSRSQLSDRPDTTVWSRRVSRQPTEGDCMIDQRRRWRTMQAVTTAGLAMLVASGCSLFGGDDDLAGAEAVADDIASALRSGDFTAVEARTDPAELHKQWDGLVGAALSDDAVTMSAEVTDVSLVDSDGDAPRAEATLAVQWTLGDHEWTYE